MLKDILIGILIRVVGQSLKTIFSNAMIILQQIKNDPSIINDSTKKIKLFEELRRKFPKNEKLIEYVVDVIFDSIPREDGDSK